MTRRRLVMAALAAVGLSVTGWLPKTASGAETAAPADQQHVLATLDRSHPRLLLKDTELAALKQRHWQDATLQKVIADVLADAEKQLGKPPLQHVIPDGLRLLATSRECLNRTLSLGFAYRWTGEQKYLRAGVSNLLTVCAFPDWNPRHFLDTAELSCAVGIGYDWFYPTLTAVERATIRQQLVKLGLMAPTGWSLTNEHNWNQVCNGGRVVGALAVAETDPELAQRIVSAAVRNLPLAMKQYAPDGAWMEGPGYWDYATMYTVLALAAMDTSLGTNFGLEAVPGFNRAGYFPLYAAGPTGQPLCYADAHLRRPTVVKGRPVAYYNSPWLFWLARKFHNADFADAYHAVIAALRVPPLAAVWYVPPSVKTKSAPRDLDRYFGGRVPLLFMRSRWDDPGALWCGVKAGASPVNHGHLDLGNFELEYGGVRFLQDLGSDNYNMPGYFGNQRYTYYRLKSESHNLPLIGGKGQLAQGQAKVIEVCTNGAEPSITMDLTSVYSDRADRVIRKVSMVANRKAVEVKDTFTLPKATELAWGLTTAAEVSLGAGGSALLAQSGSRLTVRVLEPPGARWVVESAERPPPENPNQGVSRLVLKVAAPAGMTKIKVRLEGLKDGSAAESKRRRP